MAVPSIKVELDLDLEGRVKQSFNNALEGKLNESERISLQSHIPNLRSSCYLYPR